MTACKSALLWMLMALRSFSLMGELSAVSCMLVGVVAAKGTSTSICSAVLYIAMKACPHTMLVVLGQPLDHSVAVNTAKYITRRFSMAVDELLVVENIKLREPMCFHQPIV